MKITMFFCAGAFARQMGIHDVDELDGVGRAMPWTAAAFSVGALGLIGLPPIAGFISKWYLGVGAVQAGEAWVVLLLALSALLNAAYFLPLVYRAWFVPEPGEHARGRERSVWLIVPAVVTALLSIAAGALAGLAYSPAGWATLIAERYYFP
jgi:multicomponent Na+:H+ antiporter subunit D